MSAGHDVAEVRRQMQEDAEFLRREFLSEVDSRTAAGVAKLLSQSGELIDEQTIPTVTP